MLPDTISRHALSKRQRPGFISGSRLFKEMGATSDAFQLRFISIPNVGGRAACGVIIRPPVRDQTLKVCLVAPLTLTLGFPVNA